MSNALTTLTSSLAKRFELGDGSGLMDTLKATAFKGQVSDAQMTALLIVANQYGLNPWTKEIYAFPDKNNGIVPVVGVDGWARIINGNAQFDGIEFEQDDEKCTCKIYRKDRTRATAVTEFMKECRRPSVGPWQSHPMRMLRHKAMIQCARLAFGFGGIYDQDEAERIVEKDMGSAEVVGQQAKRLEPAALPAYTAEQFEVDLPGMTKAIKSGKRAPDFFIGMLAQTYTLSADQKAAITALATPDHIDGDGVIDAEFVKSMEHAQ